MSRLKRAFRLLAGIVRCMLKNPQRTVRLLELLPSVAQGYDFSGKSIPSSHPLAEGAALETPNPLLSYFNGHREGAGIFKWTHYFDAYQEHFRAFVGREVHVMEIGVYSGGSLQMWREYFGKGCHVYGVDIEEACKTYESDGIEIFIGDQADRAFWARTKRKAPVIDILIDDGGHTPEQQRITLEEMLPHIRPGGVYLCEDIHSAFNPFAAYVQGLACELNATFPNESSVSSGSEGMAYTPSDFQSIISSIHLYPFLVILKRRERKLDQLVASRHGAQWQPFL